MFNYYTKDGGEYVKIICRKAMVWKRYFGQAS
jgi:hypothetical protein